MAAPATRRLSGMQKSVLSLYRAMLRCVGTKPLDAQPEMRTYIRAEFQKSTSIDRTAVTKIEYLMRKGQKQYLMLSSPNMMRLNVSTPEGATEDRRARAKDLSPASNPGGKQADKAEPFKLFLGESPPPPRGCDG